jgi:hypothetical protein
MPAVKPGLAMVLAINQLAEQAYKNAMVTPGGLKDAQDFLAKFKEDNEIETEADMVVAFTHLLVATYGVNDPVFENVVYQYLPADVLEAAGLELTESDDA